MCVIDRHDMTLAVEVALNPNTTNQPKYTFALFCWMAFVWRGGSDKDAMSPGRKQKRGRKVPENSPHFLFFNYAKSVFVELTYGERHKALRYTYVRVFVRSLERVSIRPDLRSRVLYLHPVKHTSIKI